MSKLTVLSGIRPTGYLHLGNYCGDLNKNIQMKRLILNYLVIVVLTVCTSCNKETFTVTFESNGGSNVATQNISLGNKVEKPQNPTKDLHTFVTWYNDAGLTREWIFSADVVTADMTLYAKWEKHAYIVTFNSNEGSTVAPQTVAKDGKATKPDDPILTGHVFAGWGVTYYMTFVQNWDFDENIVTADITLSAIWIADECDDENSYCVDVIQRSPEDTVLSESEMDVIKYLFNHNQLDYTNYLFTRFNKDELGYHHVRVYQFINNLIVLYSDAAFHFDKNDNYYFLSGKLIDKIDLDTKPSMKQGNVVELFVFMLEQDKLRDELLGNNTDIINGCFDIEFGYLNLSVLGTYKNEFVKAWKITPKNEEFPVAYINDEKSELIYYFNGIIVN